VGSPTATTSRGTTEEALKTIYSITNSFTIPKAVTSSPSMAAMVGHSKVPLGSRARTATVAKMAATTAPCTATLEKAFL
jgi:hypothetical protein